MFMTFNFCYLLIVHIEGWMKGFVCFTRYNKCFGFVMIKGIY